jgi:hypothetical protein
MNCNTDFAIHLPLGKAHEEASKEPKAEKALDLLMLIKHSFSSYPEARERRRTTRRPSGV